MISLSTLAAGAAKVEITPQLPCWLEGIPRAQPADSIHDPLYARALVVEANVPAPGASTKICLVSCDLLAVTVEYAWEQRTGIGAALGIPPERVVLACSHTHSGPAVIGFDDPAHVDPAYLEFLSARLLRVCRAAADNLQPARLGTGRGQETTISEYRRLWTRDGRIVMNWEEFAPEEIVGPAETGDPELGVIKIEAMTGETLAVVFNYACHPNSLPGDNYAVTSDFPGYAAHLIEQELGGLALFTNGALGSVDIEGFVDRNFYGVERRGQALAGAVLEVCRQIEPEAESVLRAARRSFLLPYRQIRPEALAWAREVARRNPGEAVTLRDGIPDEMKADNLLWLAGQDQPGVMFELIGLRLGRSLLVAMAGELFTEIGRRMKALSPGLPLVVVGPANGYHGYIPTAKASTEGGYATGVETGAYFTEAAEDLIEENTGLLLTDLR